MQSTLAISANLAGLRVCAAESEHVWEGGLPAYADAIGAPKGSISISRRAAVHLGTRADEGGGTSSLVTYR